METGAAQQQISTKQSIARPEIVELGEHTYEVHFKVVTICIVMEEGKQIGLGSTQWSPQDEFNYETGKKLALREAIKSRNDNFRIAFWEQYLKGARQHLKNRIVQHRAALKQLVALTKAAAYELNDDLLKLKSGVFGCEKH